MKGDVINDPSWRKGFVGVEFVVGLDSLLPKIFKIASGVHR